MSEWPFPGDTAIVRARKVAWAYRAVAEKLQARVNELDPNNAGDEVADLDTRFRQWGERWPAPVRNYDPDEWISADEAGRIAGVSGGYISSLRVAGRIEGKMVDRKSFRYQVRDVHRLAEVIRRRRESSTDRVGANGKFVPSDWQASGNSTPPITNGGEQ